MLNPLSEYTFEVTYPDNTILDTIEGLVGKLNARAWGGKSEQTLLYVGARVSEVWDESSVQGFRAAHRILGRQRSWNLFWREPRQKRYPEGNRRAGQLMWDANGQPLMVAGPAGVPGWTEMDPRVYELGDFDRLLNI